jgi:hypothetical protein
MLLGMKIGKVNSFTGWCTLLLVVFALPLEALTLTQLQKPGKITPRRFARLFKDFEYEYRDRIQKPKVFLNREKGDCDDYAILAKLILQQKGFTPRLVVIRMTAYNHVVCYLEEPKVYLDYNNRVYLRPTKSSKWSLPVIADKVARSLDARWTSVSEFSYENYRLKLLKTLVKNKGEIEDIGPTHNVGYRLEKKKTKPVQEFRFDF